MKINNKHLSVFARSSAIVDRQGYLSKQGELIKSYQRWWFILKGNLLFYYDKKNDTEPMGLIILEGCFIELSDNSEKFAFNLVFIGSSSRTYVLVADSQEDMEAWMKALACSGHDYVKNAVSMLQCQLNELGSTVTEVSVHEIGRAGLKTNDDRPILISDSTCEPVIIQPVASHNFCERRNPFDSQKETDNLNFVDEFYLKCSSSTITENESQTFEDMHLMFGDYILLRIAQFE